MPSVQGSAAAIAERAVTDEAVDQAVAQLGQLVIEASVDHPAAEAEAAGQISGLISGSHVSFLPIASDSAPPSAVPPPLVPALAPAPPSPVVPPGSVVPPPEPQPPAQEPPAIAMSTGGTGVHGSTGSISGDDLEAIMGGQVPLGSLEFRLPNVLAGQSAGNPTLDKTGAGRFEG